MVVVYFFMLINLNNILRLNLMDKFIAHLHIYKYISHSYTKSKFHEALDSNMYVFYISFCYFSLFPHSLTLK